MSARSAIPKLASACAVLAASVGVAVLPSTPAFAAGFPAHVMAPYVDTGFSSANAAISGSTLSTIANDYGDKYFTLAFVNGSGCQWSMYNASTYQSEVNNLRSMGGDAIISFGGWTADSGDTDLGAACGSSSAAATQIENVVTYFNATRIDFDIESNALSNHNDVDITNGALADVRSWASANGRSLSISYTIPVLTSGLTSDGQYVLTNGQSHGFKPDVVNIMAMDYGTSGTEMGTAAEQALDSTAGQVASIYGISSSSAYAMMGLTPMIGQNDSSGEIFTLSDASNVESYAASKGIALLSFWSEGRDNGGCPGQTTASSTCSGVSQSTGQFTTTFNPFTGGTSSGGGGGGATAGATGPVKSAFVGKCMDVNGANTANGTHVQVWDCNGTNAQVWTQYSDNTLRALGKCLDVTSGGTSDGTKLQLWDCNGTGAQVWNVSNSGYVNPQSGKCIDDPGGSTSNGTQLQIWDCNSTAAQVWSTPGGAVGNTGGPAGYTFCANENGTCYFSGTANVAFGADTHFNYLSATNSISCNTSTFGDPYPYVVKACYYQITSSGGGTSGGGSGSSGGSLSNGGFESGSLSSWSCQSGDGVVTSPVHSGSYAAAIVPTSSQTGECDQTITLSPNTTYTLTGWVQGNYAYIGVSGGASASTWTSSSSWTQLSVSFTTGSSGSVTVFVHGWYSEGNVYADDFAVG